MLVQHTDIYESKTRTRVVVDDEILFIDFLYRLYESGVILF